MLQSSTIQLLRFPFSFFLLPVYLFAISQSDPNNLFRAVVILIVLHLLIYPSSNGYNSYMDRDTESIGGVRNPAQPTRQLFVLSVVMDLLAITLGLIFVDAWFSVGILAYVLASRAYSYRGIRLKQYPLAGYLTVVCFQGALVFFLVYHGSNESLTLRVPALAMLAASLLIGGFYPLTQIYQHEADRKDGVTSISALLGYRGTFIFSAFMYTVALLVLLLYFSRRGETRKFFLLATMLLPVLVYYIKWLLEVWKNPAAASFRNSMRMNWLASVFCNLAFLTLIIWNLIE